MPVLARGRHDVGVSGKHHTANVIRSDRCVEIGTTVVVIVYQLRTDRVIFEQIAHKIDQLQVRGSAGGIESAQTGQSCTSIWRAIAVLPFRIACVPGPNLPWPCSTLPSFRGEHPDLFHPLGSRRAAWSEVMMKAGAV